MDIIDGILSRRSIRKYTAEPVSEEDIQILLKCAMQAPSAKNEQPWHFVVVTDQELRQKLAHTSDYTHMAADAPLLIVVCADETEDKRGGFWIQDCSAATQNLLLAAHGKNLGAVWCGVYPIEDRIAKIRENLNLPQNITPLGLICIGHPAQSPKPAERFIAARVHYQKW